MPRLKLTMYPTDGYIKAYSTNNPLNAALAALFAVIFATMLFLLYDFFVRREISERRQLLDAKRRFIRYVSHEVRTPLNAGKSNGLATKKMQEIHGVFVLGKHVI